MIQFRGLLGVPVQVHQSLLAFLVILVVAIGVLGGDPVFGLMICAMVFVSIYLHELGHAGAAIAQGVDVSRIVLYGGGGLCYYRPSQPKQELLIVLAGPAVNLALWLIALQMFDIVCATAVDGADLNASVDPSFDSLAGAVQLFARINMLLLIFNLLPVLPLDGGRALFLILWYKLSRDTALRITGLIGTIVAVLWIPTMILMFISFGIILLFFPSIRENWARFRGRELL